MIYFLSDAFTQIPSYWVLSCWAAKKQKRQKETEEWEFEMNMGYHICMKFYSTSELFVMHYQATTVFTSTAVTMYIALLWQLL